MRRRSRRRPRARAAASSAVVPAAHRVVVVRAGVDDAVLDVVGSGGARCAGRRVEAELQHDHAREAELVAQPLDGGRDDAEVLGDQRQLARASRGRGVERRARPGPRCQRPPARVARPPAPPSRRRSRGSGRSARGRRARTCAGSARSTSGSRAAAAPASRRAGCPTAGPCRCRRPAARRRRRRRGTAPGARGGRPTPARRRSARRRSAARRARRRSARSAAHSRSKRTWSATAPRPPKRAQSSIQNALRSRNARAPRPATTARAAASASSPGHAANADARLVRRAVPVGRPERQHLPPRLARRRRASRRTRTPRGRAGRRAARWGAAGRRCDRGARGSERLPSREARDRRISSPHREVPAPQSDAEPPPADPDRATRSPDGRRRPLPGQALRRRHRRRSSADIFRDGHDDAARGRPLPAPGRAALARGRRCTRIDAHVNGVRWAGEFTVDDAGPLGVHDRGLDRPVRHLARRARSARSPPASTTSRGELSEGVAAARGRRRARAEAARTATMIEHALDVARGRRRRRAAPSTTPRSARSCSPPSSAAPSATARRTLRAAAAARGRPRARPLPLLVRAVPALVGRLQGRRGADPARSPSSASTSSTCRRSTRSARKNRKGRNNALDRRPGRPRLAVGDRRTPRAATTRSTPSSARSTTSRALCADRARARHRRRARLRAQRSADHPWLTEHPEWFQQPPRRHAQVRREPAQEVPGHLQLQLGLRRTGAGCGRRAARSCCSWVDARREGLPRRQPAHEAVPVLGVADRRGPQGRPRRDLPRRGVHPPRGDARAGQARLHPVLHVLHLEELALGAHRVRQRARLRARSASTSGPNFFANTPDILHDYLAARRAAGVLHAARARRDAEPDATASTRATRTTRTCRCARAPRSTWTPRSTRPSERALDGPLLPLIRRINEIRRENPALQQLSNVCFLETENDALIAYAKQLPGNTRHRRRQHRSRTTPRRARRSCPAQLGLPPAFARRGPAHRRALRLAHRRATTCGSTRRPRRPTSCRVDARESATTPGHWFEAEPLWFKTAVFYEIHIARLLRRQRRRLRRLPRADREARLPAVARRRLHLAAAVLHLAAARRRLRHRRLLHDPPRLRHGRRRPRLHRGRPPARHPRDRRPGHEPHLERPPVVPGVALEPGQPQARLVRVVGHRAPLRGRADHLHRHRDVELDVGRRGAAPTSGTASSPTSPTSTTTTPRSRRRCSRSCASGSTSASTASGSTPSRTSTSARAPTARTCPRRTSTSSACARRSTPSYPDRVLLAEANQWPADVVEYFGDGDECHMAFHFPVMPRMFMALRREEADADLRDPRPDAGDPGQLPVGPVPAQPRRADARDGHRRGARLHVHASTPRTRG